MQLRTITRLAAGATTLLLAGGGLATVFAPTAAAKAQERVTLQPDQTLELDYPELVGSAQAQEFFDNTIAFDPGTCDTATWCDTIPLTVAPPQTDLATSDYTILITLSWDTKVVSVPVQGNLDSNDLDMAIWDDPVVEDAGPNQDGIRTYGATGNEPEKMALVDASGNFNIVVANASGVNHGYHLEISWKTQLLSKPFESLPPDYSSTGSLTPPAHLALGGPPAAAIAPPPAVADGGTVLPPLESTSADTSFSPVAPGAFDSALGDQKTVVGAPASAKRDLQPPSNLALLLWLLALPFGLTAIGGRLLLGRSRALLRI
jgi:hypothetical protein